MKNKKGKKVIDAKQPADAGKQAEIWAVGGGKGGTGKTFVVCQLAISLASMGKKVILIDTDLGGANVHSFFGVKAGGKNVISFFEKKTKLDDLVVATQTENLAIIPGNTSGTSPSSIKHSQKTRLLNHIKHLKADYILLDLGGGTNLDTIDAFLLADRLIAVAVPEITAIENLYQFIKSVYFRKLKSIFADHGLKDTAKTVWQDRSQYGIKTIVDLLNHLKQTSAEMETFLSGELANFSLNIVLNKVRNVRELQEGFSIKSVCIKYIGMDAQYVGYVEYDFQFWRNLSLLQGDPRFIVSHSTQSEVMKVARNIIDGNQLKIDSIKFV